MKKTFIAIAAATLIPLSAAALAGEGRDKSGSMGPSFDTLDANRDGRLSQAEASIDENLVFSSADRNSDGYLDEGEWRNREETSTAPQPQPRAMPESDQAVPEPPVSEPAPDTETPRQ